MNLDDHKRANQQLWNTWAQLHPTSDFYDARGFAAHQMSLHAIERDLLPDLKGKTAVHLQCHFGQDTLSLLTLGAEKVIGVDFSPVALEKARELAENCGLLDRAHWSLRDALEVDPQWAGKADVVFASYGVLGWHPSVGPWMDAAFTYLKPGGCLILADFHPVLWMLDEKFDRLQYPYFNLEVIREERSGSYAAPEAPSLVNYTWNHTLSDILGPLLDHPERELIAFREFDWSPYALFEATSPRPGAFQIKGREGQVPLVYAVKAIKKST